MIRARAGFGALRFGALWSAFSLAGHLHRGQLRRCRRVAGGMLAGGALLSALPAGAGPEATHVLHVRLHSGEALAAWPLPEGAELQLGWAHSVTGGQVADCFANAGGNLVLTRSYLHDFAAGLGEVAGRGQLVSAHGGGYWIEEIDTALPDNRLSLRIGAPRVGHVLRLGADICARLDWELPTQPDDGIRSLPLSQIAAGAGVWISLMPWRAGAE